MATGKQVQFAFHQLGQVLRDLESDLRWGLRDSVRIPSGWHEIAQSREVPAKEKITLRLDEDVVRFFRSMGRGHLVKMNAVLRAFMLARLAEVVRNDPLYAPTEEEVERRVRDELAALITAEDRAREAAEDRLAGKANRVARQRAVHDLWARRMGVK